MAVVVGFISEKGGVAKTTACYHIAVSLSQHHLKRVLVVDADYQRGGITQADRPAVLRQWLSGARYFEAVSTAFFLGLRKAAKPA